MNPKIKIFLLCPLPEDQKPINEYIGLKENSHLFTDRNNPLGLKNFRTNIFVPRSLVQKKKYQEKFFLMPLSIQKNRFFFNQLLWFFIVLIIARNLDPGHLILLNNNQLVDVPLGLSIVFLIIMVANKWITFSLEKRFNQARLIYEEASWYDGQIWEKPFSLIRNDRLINTQKIKPILQSKKIFPIIFTIFLLMSCFA